MPSARGRGACLAVPINSLHIHWLPTLLKLVPTCSWEEIGFIVLVKHELAQKSPQGLMKTVSWSSPAETVNQQDSGGSMISISNRFIDEPVHRPHSNEPHTRGLSSCLQPNNLEPFV